MSDTVTQRDLAGIFHAGLSDADFRRLSRLVYDVCGIKLPAHKKTMLEARLRRRLRQLHLTSFEAYCEYLFDGRDHHDELINFIDVVTTNKTDFFREAAHFSWLVERALPELERLDGAGYERPLQIWSAGCSSGEEPYTLAMVLSDYALHHPGFSHTILATDISTQVLERARTGVYALDKVAPVPDAMKRRYLMRSRDRDKELVRVVPELRSRIAFRRLNFMDDDFGLRDYFDAIFCRNVIIYFDRPTQQRMLEKLCGHLQPGRFLFMGHSETLHGMNLPLTQLAPAVYRKRP